MGNAKESLLASQWTLVFFEAVKFRGRGFLNRCPSELSRLLVKSRGTDGKPMWTF